MESIYGTGAATAIALSGSKGIKNTYGNFNASIRMYNPDAPSQRTTYQIDSSFQENNAGISISYI